MPPQQEQSVKITSESKQSKMFKPTTKFIMVHNEESCCLAFGKEPTASPLYHMLSVGETRFYGVQPSHKLAVIGTL